MNKKIVNLVPAYLNDWLIESEDEKNKKMILSAIYLDIFIGSFF